MRTLRNLLLLISLIGSVPALACDTGYAAFENTVYKKVRRDCAECHDGSVAVAPPFATEDMASSYSMLLSYMNFSNIDESLLVIRAGNGHCGKENCFPDSGKELSKMANDWWNSGEKACERNGRYFTAAMALPNNIPTKDNGFLTLTFDLGKVKNTLAGMSFQIEIQDYVAASVGVKGAYLFRAPRVMGGKKSIKIKDIKVLLNGKYDVIYNAYTEVDRTIPFFNVGSMATPILSAESMIVLKDGLPNPKLMISFVDIDPAQDSAACMDAARFKQHMKPALTDNACATCHNSAAKSMPERILDLNGADDKTCQMASAFIDPNRVMVSPLVDMPAKGMFGHPQLTDQKRYEFVQAFRAWINQ